MSTNRPVVMTVARKPVTDVSQTKGFYPEAELTVTSVRRMNVAEYAWHRLKALFTPKHQAPVNQLTEATALMRGALPVGIEISPRLWYNVVYGDRSLIEPWVWLHKYSSVLLSPVAPTSVPCVEEYADAGV